MKTLHRWMILAASLLLLVHAGAARALDLDSAKQQGLVGERTDGYVGAVAASPSAEVEALVADVNAKRRDSYAAIASKNGTAVETVAALAAQKLIGRVPSGQWISDQGRWYLKK